MGKTEGTAGAGQAAFEKERGAQKKEKKAAVSCESDIWRSRTSRRAFSRRAFLAAPCAGHAAERNGGQPGNAPPGGRRNGGGQRGKAGDRGGFSDCQSLLETGRGAAGGPEYLRALYGESGNDGGAEPELF